jgi:hypothetical protein
VAPALELQPEGIRLAVVVEAHGLAPAPVGQEEKGRFFTAAAEEGRAQRHHEPHEARQHLMHLREEYRLPRGQGARQAAAIRRAIVVALDRGLEGGAGLREGEAVAEGGRDGAPGLVAREEQGGPRAEPASPEGILRGGAGEPGGERRARGDLLRFDRAARGGPGIG